VDAFKDQKFAGLVTDIADSANNNDISTAASSSSSSSSTTGTDATKFQVKIRLTDKQRFLPGMSVTANIETRMRTNVISIPIQCVTTRMPTNMFGTNLTASANGQTNASPSPNAAAHTSGNGPLKHGDEPKPIEVVWVVDGDHVKMAPVKRGIADDNYTEIISGLTDGQEVVIGGFKAINRDLSDGSKIVINAKQAQKDKQQQPNSG
jgi:HlyD family secretion protein